MRRIGTRHHHTTIFQSDRRLHYDTMSRQSAYTGHGQNALYMESCQVRGIDAYGFPARVVRRASSSWPSVRERTMGKLLSLATSRPTGLRG
eukprot:scaffold132421_cov37-Attheya_sp.AAC.6